MPLNKNSAAKALRTRLARCPHAADQCRALGLSVGDTIVGVERYNTPENESATTPTHCTTEQQSELEHGTVWSETKLTLLWLGETIAVWSETTRNSSNPSWTHPEETSEWTLECREWRKLKVGNSTTPQKDFLQQLADLCEAHNAAFAYNNDDDGIHITIDGQDVFVGWLDGLSDKSAAQTLREAAGVTPAITTAKTE